MTQVTAALGIRKLKQTSLTLTFDLLTRKLIGFFGQVGMTQATATLEQTCGMAANSSRDKILSALLSRCIITHCPNTTGS
jgi:hypothetical protein